MKKYRTIRTQTRDQHIRAVLAGIRDLYRDGAPDLNTVQRTRQHAAAAGITQMANKILVGLFDIRPRDPARRRTTRRDLNDEAP